MNPSFQLFLQEQRAGISTTIEPEWIVGTSMNRRHMLRRGAAIIAGVSAAGLLPVGDKKADAALAMLARYAFGAAVAWVVEKTLDHLYDKYVASQPTVVEAASRPTNGRDAFHDSHASDVVITGFRTGEETRRSSNLSARLNGHIFAVPTDQRHQRYGLSCHDLNRVEAIHLHNLYSDRSVRSIPLPVSQRQMGTDEDAEFLTALLRKLEFSPNGLTLEYKRDFSTLSMERTTAYCVSHISLPGKKSLLFV